MYVYIFVIFNETLVYKYFSFFFTFSWIPYKIFYTDFFAQTDLFFFFKYFSLANRLFPNRRNKLHSIVGKYETPEGNQNNRVTTSGYWSVVNPET